MSYILSSDLLTCRSRSFAVCGPAAWNSLPTAIGDLFSSSCKMFNHVIVIELSAAEAGVTSLTVPFTVFTVDDDYEEVDSA